VPAPADIHVRISPMRRRHLRGVMRIETQVYPRPWTLSVFGAEIAQKDTRCYIVAKVGSRLVGYAGLLFGVDEAHITNVAVDPTWHRHHIGTRLMLTLLDQARVHTSDHVTLEVRVSNHGAQAMYRRFGFAPAGVRQKYYEGVEDAIVMWAHDVGSVDYGRRLREIAASVTGTTEVAL
jgi:ribosomal-protein-alanine N-acetyltransferase